MNSPLKPLRDSLHEYLEQCGFRRTGLRWNRDVGEFVDVVTIQRTKSLDAIYVNLGVQDPEIYTRWWGTPPNDVLDEADCTVRTRLGVLVDGHDRVWDLRDPVARDDIKALFAEYGLPFLESMHSRAMMVEYLQPWRREWPSAVYLALLQASQRDVEAACTTIATFRAKAHASFLGLPRLEELMVELGCEHGQ